MNIGKAIRYCRESKNISQKELAGIADVSVSHLCLIEKSKREASLATLESIATALGIPLPVLILVASERTTESHDKIDLNKLTKLVTKLIGNPN